MDFEFACDQIDDLEMELENDFDNGVSAHANIFGGHDILDNGMKIGETRNNIFGSIDMKK